ncbi:MAG TPA: glycosyltransferase [Phnomibacter sp.]|nr:glycosyltransferase [Phnomibacter sp.]
MTNQSTSIPAHTRIHIVVPVYNDWESLHQLIANLDAMAAGHQIIIAQLVVVNDASNQPAPRGVPHKLQAIECITEVELGANSGHQRAIAIGLAWLGTQADGADYVVVMDADGEDKPEDLPSLLAQAAKGKNSFVVFAQRGQRNESFAFRFFYGIYKFFFRLLTGTVINFGNYCCIPQPLLQRVVSTPDLWNHFPGSIMKSKLPIDKIVLNRGTRYFGTSKMNFPALVLHGLSSVSIFIDMVSVRLLIFCGVSMATIVAASLVMAGLTVIGQVQVPYWASGMLVSLVNLAVLFGLITLMILLLQLNQRKSIQLPPKNNFQPFVLGYYKWHPNPTTA